jgi:hypothetical protein
MIPLHSKLESLEKEYVQAKSILENREFALGGGWDYDHGSFDRHLDNERKVWLRLPFDVVNGNLDEDTDMNDAKIRFGTPFVLKHLYREGPDPDAKTVAMGGLVNQFQDPADPDAKPETKWVDKAKQVLAEVEQLFPH